MSKEIKLSNGAVAIVDDDNFEYLSQFNWQPTKLGYAFRHLPRKNGKRHQILMHREIMNAPKGSKIDHANRNKLDNRKENLRFATGSQNQINRVMSNPPLSGYRGVYKANNREAWVAMIKINYKSKYLGYFKNAVDAAKAYNKAAFENFGEFAVLNDV